MKIVLLGAPGAGKGTQAQYITDTYDIPQISTGDMLRAAVKEKSELGLKVDRVMASGSLVTDDIIIALVKERLALPDCRNGFLFDGFPRTIPQAKSMIKEGVEIDVVLEIDVPDDEIVKRLTGRRVHVDSGRVYHIEFNPPAESGIDDVSGEPLIQRTDDEEETVRKRLAVYHDQTQPLVGFYERIQDEGSGLNVIKINGVESVDKIREAISTALV